MEETGGRFMQWIPQGYTNFSDKNRPQAESHLTQTDPMDTEKDITLLLAWRDEFLITLETAVREAAEEMGYTFHSISAMQDAKRELQNIQMVRESGEKVVIINLVNLEHVEEVIQAAGDMKMVFINRLPFNRSIFNQDAVYVGSDDKVAGSMQGDWLANYFKRIGKTDIKYILLEGIPGQTTTVERTNAVLQTLQEQGISATEATPPIVANYNRIEAMIKILPVLRANIPFDAIIANNDAMALGAIEALEQLGMDPSSIPIVGIDATAAGLQAVEEGKLAMTVFQNAEAMGNTAVLAAINLENDKPINQSTGYPISAEDPYIIWIPYELVTRENVSDYY